MKGAGRGRGAVILLVAMALVLFANPALAAAPPVFVGASNSIGTAFIAVDHAQQLGGNVTGLVASLNVALGLYMRAQAENSSDPSRAAADLQNATTIAQEVSLEAPAIGTDGSAARQAQEEVSIGAAVAIIAIGVLLYLYGERIYHRLWLRLYSGYVVKEIG